jgi:hypothetical protein
MADIFDNPVVNEAYVRARREVDPAFDKVLEIAEEVNEDVGAALRQQLVEDGLTDTYNWSAAVLGEKGEVIRFWARKVVVDGNLLADAEKAIAKDRAHRNVIKFIFDNLNTVDGTPDFIVYPRVMGDGGFAESIPFVVKIHPESKSRDPNFAIETAYMIGRMLQPAVVEAILSDPDRQPLVSDSALIAISGNSDSVREEEA